MTKDPVIDHPELSWFRDRAREAYSLNVSNATEAILGRTSRIGGFPFLPADQEWPICSECRTPLFFVGQFGRDLDAFPLPDGIDLLSIYRCSNLDCDNCLCDYSGAEFFHLYETPLPTTIRVPNPTWDGKQFYRPPGIVFEGHWPKGDSITIQIESSFSVSLGVRFSDFPGWEENNAYQQIDSSILHPYMENFPKTGAKLLGHPAWIQGPIYPHCACGKRMQHLLQLESPIIYLGDMGRMHLFYCSDWCKGAESLFVVWQC